MSVAANGEGTIFFHVAAPMRRHLIIFGGRPFRCLGRAQSRNSSVFFDLLCGHRTLNLVRKRIQVIGQFGEHFSLGFVRG